MKARILSILWELRYGSWAQLLIYLLHCFVHGISVGNIALYAKRGGRRVSDMNTTGRLVRKMEQTVRLDSKTLADTLYYLFSVF